MAAGLPGLAESRSSADQHFDALSAALAWVTLPLPLVTSRTSFALVARSEVRVCSSAIAFERRREIDLESCDGGLAAPVTDDRLESERTEPWRVQLDSRPHLGQIPVRVRRIWWGVQVATHYLPFRSWPGSGLIDALRERIVSEQSSRASLRNPVAQIRIQELVARVRFELTTFGL